MTSTSAVGCHFCPCQILVTHLCHALQDRSNLVLPRRPDKRSSASMVNLSILRVLDFNSQTLKSGVVITSDDAPDGSALIFIKGAPNVIKDTVMASSVPSNFEQVLPAFISL